MGRPDIYEIQVSYEIRGDDKALDAELEWLDEQIATRELAQRRSIGGQRLLHGADPELSNSEDWVNEP